MTHDGAVNFVIPVGVAISAAGAFLAEVTVTNSLLTIVVATIPVLGAVWISRRSTKREMASIELKVDGRLEAALERIDKLEEEKSDATGEPPPPAVSGLNVPAAEIVEDTPP